MANPPTQGSNVGDLSNALVIAIQQATTNSPSTTSSAVPQMSVSQCYSSTNQSTSRGVEGEKSHRICLISPSTLTGALVRALERSPTLTVTDPWVGVLAILLELYILS